MAARNVMQVTSAKARPRRRMMRLCSAHPVSTAKKALMCQLLALMAITLTQALKKKPNAATAPLVIIA